ncbi:hypothetical protein PPACK8108_LOCUS21752 [Phakopsora pachyrhizi]|uniref:Uncharacterized protein n=1 Tax=Phakopsora pachyrhizi TaxID=170000 RepID=A0AAV0BIG3_PHAPC|nr:hypothetical protein PPACK8108_LOCUS21752 [Phakopsora pachyrhizi]
MSRIQWMLVCQELKRRIARITVQFVKCVDIVQNSIKSTDNRRRARGDDVVCELIDFWPTLGAGGVVVEMDQGEERVGMDFSEEGDRSSRKKRLKLEEIELQKFDKSFEENREIWMGSGRRMEKWMEAGSTVKSERCLFIKNEEEDEEGQKDKMTAGTLESCGVVGQPCTCQGELKTCAGIRVNPETHVKLGALNWGVHHIPTRSVLYILINK